MVALLGLGGRYLPNGLEKTSGIEPMDPLEGGELDRVEVAPRTAPPDHLGLEEADDRLMDRLNYRFGSADFGARVV